MSRVYVSAAGKQIDIDSLRLQNERVIAVGNAGVNARGDRLGEGGAVVQTRDHAAGAFHRNNLARVDKNELVDQPLMPDILPDNPRMIDQIIEAPETQVVDNSGKTYENKGLSDAIVKSQELAEKLKNTRNRI